MFRATAFALLLAFCSAAYATPLMSGEFSGGVFGSPNFSGITWGAPITGSVIYDEGLLAGHTSGYYNLSLGGVPYSAFQISLGSLPLLFTLASDTSNTIGMPALQFNNGQFNGFAYRSDFTLAGSPQAYRFNISGGVWSIKEVDLVTGLTGRQRVSGYINIGSLSNLQVYTPPPEPPATVPEPAGLSLVGGGLACLFVARRRFRRAG